MDKKDVPEVGCCNKLGALWFTNKPLCIFLALLATIIVAGIIFCVVWFIILPHKAAQTASPAPSAAVSASTPTAPSTSTSTSASAPAPTAPAGTT